jgi:hypothetical protein
MKESNKEYVKIIRTKEEVETYLAKLKYALSLNSTLIVFQADRQVDLERPIEFRNSYTVAELFPDESPIEAIKCELGNLKVTEYMETVKDINFPKRADWWTFGKKYGSKDTYIKFRVEIVERNNVFIMSFHFSTRPFVKGDFPFSNS